MKLPHHTSRVARRIFFFIHLWTGLILGLWFVMIGLTGSSLAWPELIAAEMRAMFPLEKTATQTSQISLSEAVASFKKDQTGVTDQEMAFVILPNYRFPFYIFSRPNKPYPYTLFLVDPYSGKVNPPRQVIDFTTGKLEHLHINLIMEAKGLIANGIASFFTLFMLLSGLWLWWPSNLNQLKLRLSIKRKASFPRFIKDLHNVLGIYLYAILLVTTVTAVVLAYNGSTQDSIEKALDGSVASKPVTVKPSGQRLTDDELIKRASVALPQTLLLYVKRPVKSDEPYQVMFEHNGKGFWREGTLNLDPYTGKTISIERDSQASRGHKTMALVEDLHVGLFGGLWSKILYTIAGFLPLGLFATGVLMWWRKKRLKMKGYSH